jgi:HK97 family phage major capsid protein
MSKTEYPTAPTASQREAEIEAALTAKLDQMAKAHEDRVLEGISDMISRHEGASNSEIPTTYNRNGEEVHRTEKAGNRVYRSMPLTPEERALRNEDGDQWMKNWMAGLIENNGAAQMQARAKLDQIFPQFARADTLEGAADSSGGFAAGSGGVLLPRVLEELVAIARDKVAKMGSWATTYVMSAQEHNIPTGDAMTAYMVGEATSPMPASGGEPTFAQVPLVANRGAARAVLGNDLMEDAAVNVVNFITMRGGAALGAQEDVQFLQGTPITKLAGTAHTEITSTELKYTDIVNMYTLVGQQYRSGSRWLVSPFVLGAMANVRDGMGRPFYQSLLDPPVTVGDDAGAQGTLLGRPVHEAALPAGDIYFGDVSANYAIGRRQGIRVDVSREFYFDTFRTIFLIHQRIAGNNIDVLAGRQAAGITSATSL